MGQTHEKNRFRTIVREEKTHQFRAVEQGGVDAAAGAAQRSIARQMVSDISGRQATIIH
ncbi:MAG: hypothetical protein GY820_23465 [Gammaproteobacteria bacterium]|nr:hypothetical protein [Gammaproteobacteria bacterium]